MQFHLNGFRPGDPDMAEPAGHEAPRDMPGEVDVLIVGCGPAAAGSSTPNRVFRNFPM